MTRRAARRQRRRRRLRRRSYNYAAKARGLIDVVGDTGEPVPDLPTKKATGTRWEQESAGRCKIGGAVRTAAAGAPAA